VGTNPTSAPAACPYCAGSTTFWFRKPAADATRDYSIFRCGCCSSAFVYPVPSIDELQAFYTLPAHANRRCRNDHGAGLDIQSVLAQERAYPNSVLDAARIAKAAKALTPGTQFLDVGAGFGFFSRAAKAEGFEVEAIEINDESLAVFREMNGFEATKAMLDHEFAEQRSGRYSVVLLSQVLEHVRDVNSAVVDLRSMLAPRGICVIAVPHFGSLVSMVQGRNDMFITPPEHLNYFSRAGLMQLFSRHGFECCGVGTHSRFDSARLQRKLRVPILGSVASRMLSGILRTADMAARGMLLNAYFRKI
jgi:SAM-dependent methyltransferase